MLSGLYPYQSPGVGAVRPASAVHDAGGLLRGQEAQAGQRSAAQPEPTASRRVGYTEEELARLLAVHEQEQAALAPERAYAAAGRLYARGMHPGNDTASFAGVFGAMQPGTGAQTADHAGPAGGLRSPEAPAAGGAEAGRRQEGGMAEAGVVSGGVEARSAERTFIGGGADSSGTGRNSDRRESAADGAEEDAAASSLDGARNLSREEEQILREMEARDKEVRTHEQAHMSSGGGLVSGGASYQEERGPDGKMYAVGGEVQIDTSEGSTPSDTIARAQRIKAAALAPAQPSAQDRKVAAQASQMETKARLELREAREEEEAESTQKAEGKTGAGEAAGTADAASTGASGGALAFAGAAGSVASTDAAEASGNGFAERAAASPGWERRISRGSLAYRQNAAMSHAYAAGSILSSVA